MSLGEDVMKYVIDQMMINKVTINLNMFGMLMKNIIVGNINDTSIIVVDVCSFGLKDYSIL